MPDLLIQFLWAIFTGVVASGTFALLMLLIRPRIAISDYICFDKNSDDDEKTKYYIKVVNKTLFDLVDIQYTLSYVTKQSDGKNFIETIDPMEKAFTTMERRRVFYDCKHKEFDNAYHISYDINEDQYPVKNDFQEVDFTIVARHSVSGTIKCVRKTFTKDAFKIDSQHSLGMGLDFQKTHRKTKKEENVPRNVVN
ncbi:MAG: hypothetical protein J5625_00465 [Lachnospiraceae bacterium]|nr:hypothetical protein [Lachnospiraceae bacterium]